MANWYVSTQVTIPPATHTTIAAINAEVLVVDGDNIFLNRGETYNDATLLTGDPNVTFDAYGSGALPIIDGLDGTRNCMNVSQAGVTVNNLELIGGSQCLLVSSSSAGITTNDLTLRGSPVDGATTEVFSCTTTGTGHVHTNMNLYQGHSAANSKGIRFTGANGIVFENLNLIGVVGLTSINAIELITNTTAVTFNNTTMTNWNGRGGSGSRIVYVRGGIFRSNSFTMNDCDGTFYANISGSESDVQMDVFNVTNLTGSIQTENATIFQVDSGTWVNSNCSVIAGSFILSNINTTGRPITMRAGTVAATLTDITSTGSTSDGITCNATNVTITRATVTTATTNGISVVSGAAVTRNCVCTNNGNEGLRTEGSATIDDEDGVYSNNANDGVAANGTGQIDCLGTVANSNGSAIASSGDGFTAHDTSTLNIVGCEASKNFKSGVAVVQGSSGTIHDCSFYDNFEDVISPSTDNYGIRIDATGGWDVRNCITEGHTTEINITAVAVTAANVTIDYGCYNNTRVTLAFDWNGTAYNWADYLTNSGQDVNSVNDDPDFVGKEAFNLSLLAGSPALGIGNKHWGNNPRPHGTNGEPKPDTFIDLGSNQSTFNVNHPANL